MKIKLFKKLFATFMIFSFLYSNTAIYAMASDISGVTPNGNIYNIEAEKFSGNTQFRHYDNFNLSQGDIANLIYKMGYQNFVNLVNNQVNINGILNTMKDGNFYNGHAIFVSPNGMVVGASGVLNVGSLSILTPGQSKFGELLDRYNADNLANYVVGAEGYKGLIQDSQGNILVNGQILARNGVNLYGKNIVIDKAGGSPDNIGIIAGWQDDITSFTDAEAAKSIFDSLVSNNIKDVTNFALKDGKIQIIAQNPAESVIAVKNANIGANNIDISAKAEYTDKQTLLAANSAEITLVDSNIGANSIKISSAAKQERKIKPDEITMLTNSGVAGTANSTVNIDGTKITTTSSGDTNSVVITSNADSITSQNLTLLDSTILDLILGIITDEARIDEYFSDGIYNGFQGARSSSIINVANNSIITSEKNAAITSNANSDLTISSTENLSASSLSLFGLGTSTVSKAIVENSTLKAKEDVLVNAFSSNNNSLDISNAAELKQKEKNPFAIDILNNTIQTDTQALIKSSTVNAKNLETTAANFSVSNSNVSMSSVGKEDGSFFANSLSLIGVLNRSNNNVSAVIEDSNVDTTGNTTVLAQSVNTVHNIASSNSSANKKEDKKDVSAKDQEKIKKTLNEKVNKQLADKYKEKGGVTPKDDSPIFTASGIFSWNKTINNTTAEIKNSTIKSGNDVNVQANTVDITANKVTANGGAKGTTGSKFAAGLSAIYNDQQNNTNAKITKSNITSNTLNVNSTTELPVNSEKLQFEMTLPFNVGWEENAPYVADFVKDDMDKWDADPGIPISTANLPSHALKFTESLKKKPDIVFNNLAQSTSMGNSADITGAVIYNSVKNTTNALITDSLNINTQKDVVLNAVNSVIGYNAAGLVDDLLVNPALENADPAFGLGANFLWNIYENATTAKIDSSTIKSQNGDVNVLSANEQAFLSVATTGGKSKGLQVDGSVSVQKLSGETVSEISNSSNINANNVNVNAGKANAKLTDGKIEKTDKGILKFKETREVTEQVSNILAIGAWRAPGSSPTEADKVAVGASVNVENNLRKVRALVEESTVVAKNDLNVNADAYSQNLDVVVATAYSGGTNKYQQQGSNVKNEADKSQDTSDLTKMFEGLFKKDDKYEKDPLGDSKKPLNNSFSLSVAGAVSVKNDSSEINSSIIKSEITSGEKVNVISENEARKIQTVGTSSKSTKVGAGAAVGIYRQGNKDGNGGKVIALIDDSKINYTNSDSKELNVKANNEVTILDISTGAGSAAGSGFAATAGGSLIYNTLSEEITSKIKDTVVKAEDSEIETNITANQETVLTVIAGSAMYSKGKDLGIGAGLAMAYNNIKNTIGTYLEDSTLDNIDSLDLTSDNNIDISDYTVAGVLVGGTTGVEFNGSSGVDFIHNNVYSRIINSSVNADDDVSVIANSETENVNLAGTLDLNTSKKGVGVNGDVVVNVHKNNVEATIDKDSKILNSNKVDVLANTKEKTTITPIGSGIAFGGNNMAAANVVVSDINNTTRAIASGEINSTGNLNVAALDDTMLYERGGNLGVTVGGTVNIGGIVNIDSFRKTVEAKVENAIIKAADILVSATSENSMGGTKKPDGTYDILDITSDNYRKVLLNDKGDGLNQGSAFKNWNMFYDLDFGSKLEASGTVIVKKVNNTVNAYVSKSKVTANNLAVLADDYSIKNIIAGEIDASLRGGINGTVLITKDTSTLNAVIDNNSDIDLKNDLNLRARNKKDNIEVVVGAGGSLNVTAHANVVTNNSNDTTTAKIENSTVSANNSVKIDALNDVKATRVLFTGGGAKNVGINVEPLINSYTGSTIAKIINSTINKGAINLKGHDSVTSLDIVAGLAVAGQGFSGNGIAIKNMYNNKVFAGIEEGSIIDIDKDINIITESILKGENWTVTVGFTFQGASLAADVILNDIKSTIESYIANSEIKKAGNISLSANKNTKDTFKNVAGGGDAAVQGLAAQANVIYNLAKENNVKAYIENTGIEKAGSVSIITAADRFILNRNVSVAAAGQGVGIAANTIVDEFDSNIYSYIDAKNKQMMVGDVDVRAKDTFGAYNTLVTVGAAALGVGGMACVNIENSNSIIKAEILSETLGTLNANSVNVLANSIHAMGDTSVGVALGFGAIAGNVTLVNLGQRTNPSADSETRSQIDKILQTTKEVYEAKTGNHDYTPTSTPSDIKTGAIAQINGNVTSQGNVNIKAQNSLKGVTKENGNYNLSDTFRLTNVQVGAGVIAAGVGVKRVKLANNTYAGITGGKVTSNNGSVTTNAETNSDVRIKNVEVNASGLSISGSSAIYENANDTTAEIKDAEIKAKNDVKVESVSTSNSDIDGTSVIVSGANIAGISISDNTAKNKSIAKISGNTNIDADGKLTVHSTANTKLSSVLRTVVVSGVQFFGMIRDFADVKSQNSAVIENVNGTFNVGNIDIVSDSKAMESYARANYVSVTGATAGTTNSNGAYMESEMTAGINSATGLTINNKGTTRILAGVNADNWANAANFKADSKILSTSVGIAQLVGTALAFSENKAKVTANLNAKEHNANSLNLNAYLNEEGTTTFSDTSVQLLKGSGITAEADFQSSLDVNIGGVNNITNNAIISAIHNATSDVNLRHLAVGLIEISVPKIKATMNNNTNVTLGGEFNSKDAQVSSKTTRNSAVDFTSGAGGALSVTTSNVGNSVKGNSILTLNGLIANREKNGNLSISNISENTNNTITKSSSGGLINVNVVNIKSELNPTTKIDIKNNSDINSSGLFKLDLKNENIIQAGGSQKSGGFITIQKEGVNDTYASNVELNIENSNIHAVNVDLITNSILRTLSNDYITYVAKAGGFVATDKMLVTNTINQSSIANIINSTVQAENKANIAVNTNTSFKQKISTQAGGFAAVPSNVNTLNVNNTEKLVIGSGSNIIAGNDLYINLDSNNNLEVNSYSEQRSFGGRAFAESYLRLAINNEIANHGLMEAGDNVNISLMTKSINNLTQYAYAYSIGAVPLASINGELKETYTNRVNVDQNAKIVSGKDVVLNYASGTGSKSSKYHYLCKILGFIPKSANRSNKNFTLISSLDNKGEIIAGQGNSKYMLINRDGSVDKNATQGFYESEYALMNGEKISPEAQKESDLRRVDLSISETNAKIEEIDKQITSIDKVIEADVQTHATVNKVIETAPKEVKHYNDILKMMNTKISETSGLTQEVVEKTTNGFITYLGTNPDATFENYLATIPDTQLSVADKAAITKSFNAEMSNVKSNDYYTSYNNCIISDYKEGSTTELFNPIDDLKLSRQNLEDIINYNKNEKLALEIRKEDYDNDLTKLKAERTEIENKRYEEKDTTYSVVFTAPIVSSNGKIVLNGMRSSNHSVVGNSVGDNKYINDTTAEITGTGDFVVASSGLQIDNYSNRDLIFLQKVDMSNNFKTGLFIGNKDFQKFQDAQQIVSGILTDKYMWNNVGTFESLPTTGGNHFKSKENGIIGITINNYFDALNPTVLGQKISNIIFNDILATNVTLSLFNESGDIKLLKGFSADGIYDIVATQGNVAVNQNGNIVLKDKDRILGAKSVELNANNIVNNGKIVTGYADRNITITDDMLSNLIVDPTTGKTNMINLNNTDLSSYLNETNNIKALYDSATGEISLFEINLENYGKLVLNPKNTYSGSGTIVNTKGFAHINIDNQTNKQINVNKITNNAQGTIIKNPSSASLNTNGYEDANVSINSKGNVNVINQVMNGYTAILNPETKKTDYIPNNKGKVSIVSNNGIILNELINKDILYASGGIEIYNKAANLDINGNIYNISGDIKITNSGNDTCIKKAIANNLGNIEINNLTNGNLSISENAVITLNKPVQNTFNEEAGELNNIVINNNVTTNSSLLNFGTVKNYQNGNVVITNLGENGSDIEGVVAANIGDVIINNNNGKTTISGNVESKQGNIQVTSTDGLDVLSNASITTSDGSISFANNNSKGVILGAKSKVNSNGNLSVTNNGTDGILFESTSEINSNGKMSITNNGESGISINTALVNTGNDTISISNTGENGTTVNGNVNNVNGGDISITNTGKLSILSNLETKRGDVSLDSKDGIVLSGMLSTDNGSVDIQNTETDGIILNVNSIINANGKVDISNAGQNGIVSNAVITNIGNDTISFSNTGAKGTTIDGDVNNINGGNISVINTGKLSILSDLKTKRGDISLNSEDGIVLASELSTDDGNVDIQNTETDGIIFNDDSVINANGKVDISNAGQNGIVSNAVITNIGNNAITISNTGTNGATINGAVKNTNGGDISVTNTGKLNISSVIKTKQGDVNINSKDGITFAGTLSTNNGDVRVENTDTDGIILATASMINANGKIDVDNKGAGGIISSTIITNIGNDTITIKNTGADGTTINGAVKNTNGGDISVTNTGKLNINSLVETPEGDINLLSSNGIYVSGSIINERGNTTVNNTTSDGVVFDYGSAIKSNGELDITNDGTNGTNIGGSIINTGDTNITNNNGEFKLSVRGSSADDVQKGTITNAGNLDISSANGINVAGEIRNKNGQLNITNGKEGITANEYGVLIDQTQLGSDIVYGLIENECQGLEDSITLTNYNNGGITINGQLVNVNDGALNILNVNESENSGIQAAVESIIRNNQGDLYIANSGKNGIELSGNIDVPKGTIAVLDFGGKKHGITVDFGDDMHKDSGSIILYNEGTDGDNGITIMGRMSTDDGDIIIYNSNSDIKIGSYAQHPDEDNGYIVAKKGTHGGGNVYISVENGSILNCINDAILDPQASHDKGNPDDTYKTLIFADGNLSLNVIDGNIGSVSGNAGSIDSSNINYRDSINVNVKGDIDIYADNGNRTDPRIVNVRAKESDLNLSSVWVNGDVILSAPDWKQADSSVAPSDPEYYKGYSILNTSNDPVNGIVAHNLTLISSDNIGSADRKLDYTQISNGVASFEAENDINMNMYTMDEGATLNVNDIIAKQGSVDIFFDDNSDIKNIITPGKVKIAQEKGDLIIKNIGSDAGIIFNDMLENHDKISMADSGAIPQTVGIAVNGDDSVLAIYNAYVKGANNGAGAYDSEGNRISDIKLAANNIIATASDVPNSNISTKKNPNGLNIIMPENTVGIVARGDGIALDITGKNNSNADNTIVSVNNDNATEVIFNKLYVNDAYINSKNTDLLVVDGSINNYAEITNGNGSSYGNLKAVVDNDFRRLIGGRDNPVSIQLFTAKTGNFGLGLNDSIVMYTSAPIVHFEPHKLANTYSDENSFYNLGMKETSVQQNFIKHKKDEIPYKWLDEKYELTFDTDMDIDLVSNVKIYRISRTGAYIKNDSCLNVGSVKPINIKINKSDIDVTVNAKVVNIENDKAQVKFLDMPEDVANKIMYRYFQKANNKNIDLTYNSKKGEKL